VSDLFHLQREMGCTRAEFMAWLPGATRRAPLQIEGDRITVITHGGCVEISLQERPPRRLVSMELPVLAVSFSFRGLDELTRDDFLAYFDLYTQRGGG